eukprot:gene8748-10350_t
MNQCQVNALLNVDKLVSSSDFDYCLLNDGIVRLGYWYDSDSSWASTVWFIGRHWRDRLNQGAFTIATSAMLLFLIISVLANIKIVHYHITSAPHPKYSLTALSKLCIRVHVFTGILGVALPLYVFFSSDEPSGFIVMCAVCAADFIFALTAFMQTPNVHGVRVLTVPLYYVCVFFKVVINCCLLQSLVHDNTGGFKTQVQWLWMVWVVHQTYAWVRIFYNVFSKFDSLRGHIYSVSVLMAGAICIGAVFGVYLFVAWIIAIWLMYFSIGQEVTALIAKEDLSEDDVIRVSALADMWKEWHYNIYYSDAAATQRARELCAANGIRLTSPEVLSTTSRELKASILFHTIDVGGSGEMSIKEVECFLARFGVVNPSAAAKTLLQDKKCIGLSDFTEHFVAFYEYAFAGLVYIEAEHVHPSVRRKLQALAARHEDSKVLAQELHILKIDHHSLCKDYALNESKEERLDDDEVDTPASTTTISSEDNMYASL